MNSDFKSGKQFRTMAFRTAAQTPVLAILAYLCFLFFTIFGSYKIDALHHFNETAYFWNDLRDIVFSGLANAAFIAAGVINALITFSFCWSKKHSNVIFSLGVKRSDIYFSRLIGGLVPMAASITLAGITETVVCYTNGGLIDGRYISLAALTCLQFFAVYALAYTLSCAVMSNTGNVVEGILFTAILSVFTMILSVFLDTMFWSFTHGAAIEHTATTPEPVWNWDAPFLVLYDYKNEFIDNYFYVNSLYNITFNHWSGIISALCYSVAVSVLGFLGFRKRRNEICGTWGRAKGLNEIVGAVSGFYGFYFIFCIAFYPVHGDGNLLTFIYGCIAFLAVYLIFKLVFGYKRKKELRAALNRFPAYVMGLGAVCLVFTFGLFGYSSEVPEVSEVSTVTVSSFCYNYMDDGLNSSSHYALKDMNTRQSFIEQQIEPIFSPYERSAIYPGKAPGVHFTTDEDIQKVIDLHKKLVSDGKIKNSGADCVGANIRIKYVLDDGTEIERFYSESTEDVYEKLFALNSTKPVKETLKDYLKSEADVEFYRTYVKDAYSVDTDISYYDNYFATEYHDTGIYNNNKTGAIALRECHLFPTDMSGGYNIGQIDQELFDAICDDIIAITPEQYFNHSSADEIGVLSFGLSNSSYISEYEDIEIFTPSVIVDEYGNVISDESEDTDTVGTTQTTSWNINSRDIKAIVLTKDMKNTIAYFEKHGLMKHFEVKRDISDIRSVKVATLGELYGEKNKSNNIPLFYGAYWTGVQMKEWIEEYENSPHGYIEYRFDRIDNDITDRTQIKNLLDRSLVFGFCSNKDKIMEITYSDGAVATVLVKAE
jgi:hypothetical protein